MLLGASGPVVRSSCGLLGAKSESLLSPRKLRGAFHRDVRLRSMLRHAARPFCDLSGGPAGALKTIDRLGSKLPQADILFVTLTSRLPSKTGGFTRHGRRLQGATLASVPLGARLPGALKAVQRLDRKLPPPWRRFVRLGSTLPGDTQWFEGLGPGPAGGVWGFEQPFDPSPQASVPNHAGVVKGEEPGIPTSCDAGDAACVVTGSADRPAL